MAGIRFLLVLLLALSVSAETEEGFMLVKEGGYCGDRGELLSTEKHDAVGCAFLAQGAGAQSFFLGVWFRRGYCYAGSIEVPAELYVSWAKNKQNPECPAGDGWTLSKLYDFYALAPLEQQAAPELPTCQADRSNWDAGWGDCATYLPSGSNRDWCSIDSSEGFFAEQVCQECDACADSLVPAVSENRRRKQ